MSTRAPTNLYCRKCDTFVDIDNIADGEMEVHRNMITFICPFCQSVQSVWRVSEDDPRD